jgi:hypothetical protein
MFSRLSTDTGSVSVPIPARCPECGREVILSDDVWSGQTAPSAADRDRLAHALCGCYILSMPSGSLARLFASLLEVRDDDLERA